MASILYLRHRRDYMCRRLLYLVMATAALMFLIYQLKPDPVSSQSIKSETIQSQFKQRVPERHDEMRTHFRKYFAGHTNLSKILNFAEKVNSHGKPVLVALINKAYLSLAYSWLCNTMYMDIHKQVLLITDRYSQKKIQTDWPAVTVVSEASMDELSGAQEYSRAGYMRLVVTRSQVILSLLEGGVDVLLFEVDCVWLTNPIPACQQQVKRYDIVAAAISGSPYMVAGGFLYIVPTNRLIRFWRKLHWWLQRLDERIRGLPKNQTLPRSENDQRYFSKLIRNKYAGIKVNVLPFNLLADGRWYKLSKRKQKDLKPLIINNNWVIGKNIKIRRAKKFGHWFWIEKSGTCDKELVNKTVY